MPDRAVMREFEDFVLGKLGEIRKEFADFLEKFPESEFDGKPKENTLLSAAVYTDHVSMFVITDGEKVLADKYEYFGRRPWEEE